VFVERRTLELLLVEGLSLAEIGRRLGKDHSTVGYWLKKHGLVANGRGKYAARGGIRRESLASLVEEGLNLREIAERLGCSISTVQYWLRKYDLRTTGARRPVTFDRDGQAWGDCPRHGRSGFVLRRSDGYYRCSRCRSEAVAQRRRRVKEILVRDAGGRCHLCGYDRYAGALQFHHLDPGAKTFSLSHGGMTRSLARARAEASKCALLCSNCHAEVEGGIVQLPKEMGTSSGGVPHSDGPG
jgi:transposase